MSARIEKFIDNTYSHIKSTTKIMILQIKSIFSSGIMLFTLFLLPIIMLLSLGVLLTSISMLASAFGLVEQLIIGILFGYLIYSFNSSTLGDNIELTSIKSFQRMLSIIITTLLFVMVSVAIELIVFIILEDNEILFMQGFVFQVQDAENKNLMDIVWSNINFGAFTIYILQTFMLSTAIYYLVSGVLKSYQTFSIFVLVWLILVLVFGSTVSSGYYWYDTVEQEFVRGSAIVIDKETGTYHLDFSAPIISKPSDYTQFFIPQYYNNQHFFYLLQDGAINPDPSSTYTEFPNFSRILSGGQTKFMYWSKFDKYWNWTLLAPYLYTLIIVLFGKLVRK